MFLWSCIFLKVQVFKSLMRMRSTLTTRGPSQVEDRIVAPGNFVSMLLYDWLQRLVLLGSLLVPFAMLLDLILEI